MPDSNKSKKNIYTHNKYPLTEIKKLSKVQQQKPSFYLEKKNNSHIITPKHLLANNRN